MGPGSGTKGGPASELGRLCAGQGLELRTQWTRVTMFAVASGARPCWSATLRLGVDHRQ